MSKIQKFVFGTLLLALAISISVNLYYYRFIKDRQVRPTSLGGARGTLR